jgi:hypothetical protein
VDYDDRGLAAMPKLVGGPKYARPPAAGIQKSERPPDPDDLPLLSARTDEDHALARELGLDGLSKWDGAAPASLAADSAGHAAAAKPSSSIRGLGGIIRGRGNGRSGAS